MRTDRPETAGGGVRGAAYRAVEKVANTKPVVKATKAVAKQVQKRDIKNNKKAVNAVADMQAKTKAEKIAKNSVRVVSKSPDEARKLKNAGSTFKTEAAKSGLAAKVGAKSVKTGTPKTTVKVNSAPKKKGK